MVGAVLTQNTSWSNVSKAITQLKNNGLLSFETLSLCSADEIAPHIRSSGYFNLKARRLRNLLDLIGNYYDGKLELFLNDALTTARENLLEVKGIGPETADSILLYACGHPIFVIDMYTHRVFSRHNLVMEESDYQGMQQIFMQHLPHDSQLFNDFHALIVRVATTYCKKNNPLCDKCPLQGLNL
ncbi:MAG: endonuclease III domain-containing protein [Proteobacteria bacterium]|nr:endonuclease III domain-containing protein [Pseudomonadota bacterium]